jgi:hypothetical protein
VENNRKPQIAKLNVRWNALSLGTPERCEGGSTRCDNYRDHQKKLLAMLFDFDKTRRT